MKYVVYKITFPNGKIYVGKDIGGKGHSLRYFGSWSSEAVMNDLTDEQIKNLTLTKNILFESESKEEVSQKEVFYITTLQSNNPDIGYNRTHRAVKDLMVSKK